MTDRDKRELADVFSTVLNAHLQRMETNIAAGIVEMLDQLSEILQGHNQERMRQMTEHYRRKHEDQRTRDELRRPVGFGA